MSKKYFAAMDLGTNSCRILVTDECGCVVFRDARTVKLGEGMKECFTDEAIKRVKACLREYKKALDKYNPKYRAIATAACRHVKNGEGFIEEIKREFGIEFEVISGDEEARLNLRGAISHVVDKSRYVLVYDMGGGSTEITLARNNKKAKIIHTISIPWGSRNSCEHFDLKEYDVLHAKILTFEIEKYVKKFIKDSGYEKYAKDMTAVATSSSPLRLYAMVKKMGEYDREACDGGVMNVDEMDEKIKKIYGMNMDERIRSHYMGKNRGPIFISACVIFKAIYDGLGLKEITASLRAAQEAIIEELIND